MISVVDDLPLVPTTWIDSNRCWGMPRTDTSFEMRSRPKTIPSGCREPRNSSACSALHTAADSASRARRARPGSARALRARPRRHRPGALATKPSLASLRSARLTSASQRRPPLGRGARTPARCRPRPTRGPRPRRPPSAARRPPPRSRGGRAGRRTRAAARLRRQVVRQNARRGHPAELAPAPDLACELDRGAAARPRPRRRIERSSGSGYSETISSLSVPGTYDQISSVTNGITGCASARTRPRTWSRLPAASGSPSHSRGLTISRYQSQSSE